MDDLARRELNSTLNNITAKHAQRVALGLVDKSRTDRDIACLERLFQVMDILGQMLAVGIKLNGAVVPMPIGIFNSRLKCAGKTKVAGQIQKRITVITAHCNRAIGGTVINN